MALRGAAALDALGVQLGVGGGEVQAGAGAVEAEELAA